MPGLRCNGPSKIVSAAESRRVSTRLGTPTETTGSLRDAVCGRSPFSRLGADQSVPRGVRRAEPPARRTPGLLDRKALPDRRRRRRHGPGTFVAIRGGARAGWTSLRPRGAIGAAERADARSRPSRRRRRPRAVSQPARLPWSPLRRPRAQPHASAASAGRLCGSSLRPRVPKGSRRARRGATGGLPVHGGSGREVGRATRCSVKADGYEAVERNVILDRDPPASTVTLSRKRSESIRSARPGLDVGPPGRVCRSRRQTKTAPSLRPAGRGRRTSRDELRRPSSPGSRTRASMKRTT